MHGGHGRSGVPLIRAMRGFFGRRMAVHETYYPDGRIQQTGVGAQATGITWMLIVIIAIPLLATLVLIGLFYEVIRRLDGARLDNRLRWALSTGLGILVAAGFAILLRSWLFNAALVQ